jgi:hypothetical protein
VRARLTLERRQIAAVLADLPGTVGELRTAPNQLRTIVGGLAPTASRWVR